MKEQLLAELVKEGLPNLEMFKTSEALVVIPDLLQDLLKEERDKFNCLLEKQNNDLEFSDFVEPSLLDYLWRILNHIDSCFPSLEMRNLITKFRPLLDDLINEEMYSKLYYEKILWFKKNKKLSEDQSRILDLWVKNYEQRGINLGEDQQEILKDINKEYSNYSEKFQHNVVDDQAIYSYYIPDDSSFDEFPGDVLEKLKKLACEEGGYRITADPTLLGDILKYCSDPKIRRDVYYQEQSWATKGEYDNRPIVLKLLELADRKAKILGYDNSGELFLWNTMAKNPFLAHDFISSISEKALQKASEELEELKKVFDLEKIEAYDVPYYVRKYKEAHYLLDENQIKQYFEFEHTVSWLHNFVKEFLGIELRLMGNLGDEKCYEVYKDGKLISYYILDAFYRKGKRPGAWADILREKSVGKLPIVFNVANFQKNENGPTLLYLRNVETLFHEFGHALHAMLSKSEYAYLNGFNVEWDFVECPSQLMENRVKEEVGLKSLSCHYLTGNKLSDDILRKLSDLNTFMMGFWVARQNELALLDLHLYTHKIPKNVESLDKEILEVVNKYSYFKRGEEYKMYCGFLHIFGGGYEARYYSYMWAEAYAADVFSLIKEKGLFNSEMGHHYREKILEQGCRKTAKEVFLDFAGREVSLYPLLKHYGLN